MLGLVPLGSAPIGTLSLSNRIYANRDSKTSGWSSGATGAIEGGGIVFDKTEDFSTAYATTHSRTILAPGPLQTLVFFINNNTFPGITISNLTDTGGGTWILDAVYMDPTFGFYRRIGGSTTGNITISWTSSNLLAPLCRTFYLTGASQTLTVDSTTNGSFGYTSAVAAAITTTSNNALILSAINRGGGGTSYVVTPTSAGTERLNVIDDGTLLQFLIQRNAGAAGSKTLTGTWEASGGYVTTIAYRPVQLSAVLADNLDEDSPDNSDYSRSTNLFERQEPLIMELNQALEAGTYQFNFTAQKDSEIGEVKLTLLDSSLVPVGGSSWTGLSNRDFNTYNITATTTAVSAYIKIQARGDASLIIDFTDPDRIDSRLKNYASSPVPGKAEPMTGLYTNKYGFLTSNLTNILYTSSILQNWSIYLNLTTQQNVGYAPDNTLTADKATETTTTGEHYISNGSNEIALSANTVITRSVCLKAAGRQYVRVGVTAISEYSAVFNLSGTGSVSGQTNLEKASIEVLSGGWYRCSITFLTGAATTDARVLTKLQADITTISYAGDTTKGVFVWGQQLQQGWNRTNYDSNPALSQRGYSWRINHGNTYKYLTNNLLPTSAPGTTLSNIGSPQNATFSSVGKELAINCTSSTNNSQFTLSYSNAFYKKGSAYEVKQIVRADARSNGAGSEYYVGKSHVTPGFYDSGTTNSRVGLVSQTTGYSGSSVFTFAFYNKGSGLSLGDIGGIEQVTIREIERTPLGLPFEQYCGNSLLWSTDLTNASWTAVGITPAIDTNDRVSPSGDVDAWEIVDTGGFGPHYISQNVTFTAGATAVLSVFVESGTIQLRVDDGVGGYWANFSPYGAYGYVGPGKDATSTATIEYVTNNWSRCSLTFVATTSGTFPVYIQVVPGASSAKNASFTAPIYPTRRIWGPQIDLVNTSGLYKPTLYKPTTNAAAYAGNVAPMVELLDNDFYTLGTPFTVYLEYGFCRRTGDILWSAGQVGSNTNQFYINRQSSNSKVRVGFESLPTTSFESTNTFDPNTMNFIAVRFEPGNYAISLNGVLTTFNSTREIPTTWTRMILGNTYTLGQSGNGHMRKFRVYPRALTDGELLQLTGTDNNQDAAIAVLTASF